jgi:hypothetical protein
MVLSKVIEDYARSTPGSFVPLAKDAIEKSELKEFQRLIERATGTGWLTRQDEDVILAYLVKRTQYSREKCELFRQLQERVWQAELYLES